MPTQRSVFGGSARGVVGEWAGTYPLLSRHTFRSASFVISHAAMVAECGEPARAGRTDALEPTMVDPPQKVSAQTSQRRAVISEGPTVRIALAFALAASHRTPNRPAHGIAGYHVRGCGRDERVADGSPPGVSARARQLPRRAPHLARPSPPSGLPIAHRPIPPVPLTRADPSRSPVSSRVASWRTSNAARPITSATGPTPSSPPTAGDAYRPSPFSSSRASPQPSRSARSSPSTRTTSLAPRR